MKLGVAGWKQRGGSCSGTNVQLRSGALHRQLCCWCWEQKTTGQIGGTGALPLTESLCSAILPCDHPYSETLGLLMFPPPQTPPAFTQHDMWSCGHPLDASSPASVHHYYNKCPQGLKIRSYCSPCDPTIPQEKQSLSTSPLAAEFITWALICCAPRIQ